MDKILQKVLSLLQPNPQFISPVAANQGQVQGIQSPQRQGFSSEDYQRAIEEGFKNWGSPPAATLSSTFAKSPEYAPIFEEYPFLLPAISILETSGGAKQAFKNNPLNYGIQAQKTGDYAPNSPQRNIQDAMTAIGGRGRMQGYTESQLRNSAYYEPFRQSKNLDDLGNTYAPSSDNPGTGGKDYARNLKKVMEVFQSKLRQ